MTKNNKQLPEGTESQIMVPRVGKSLQGERPTAESATCANIWLTPRKFYICRKPRKDTL